MLGVIKLIGFSIAVLAAINASIFMVMDKYGLFEWYDTYRRKWMPDRCDFCVAFWLGFIEVSAFQIRILYFYPLFYISAFAAASITIFIARK